MNTYFDESELRFLQAMKEKLEELGMDERVNALNEIRASINEVSPFKENPTDNIIWVKADKVISNDYNPNKVARPEMLLLKDSIENDGVTMNIVAYHDKEQDLYIVVDGFHRWTLLTQQMGWKYIPISPIRKSLADRMASTIRHNRARGKHEVELMSQMVENLLDLGWNETKIAKHLGMEAEEVLRLKREQGIGSHFSKQPYSKAWVRDTDDVVLDNG